MTCYAIPVSTIGGWGHTKELAPMASPYERAMSASGEGLMGLGGCFGVMGG